MRKPSFSFLTLIALIASVAQADTIHLKNGSLLKGKVTNFADDQFIVMLDTGSGRYLSKAMVFVGDVARIEFDSASGGAADSGSSREPASTQTPGPTEKVIASKETSPRDIPAAEAEPRASAPTEAPTRVTQPVEAPRDTTPAEPQPSAVQPKDPDPQPEKVVEKPAVISPAASEPQPETEKPSRKLSGSVKTVAIDVVGKRDWTSSGLLVKRGDRIHISGTGTVTIDPTNSRTSGPEGLPDLADPKKLMPDQPTGALIGVIGADNDDFIFIGRSAEFTAARDGLLFLSVNEGTLSDNTGTYKAVIEVQLQRK